MTIVEKVKAEYARAHGMQEALYEKRHQETRKDVRRRDKLILASVVFSGVAVIVSILVAIFK
ncbi:hypothetical protein N9L06_07010 [Mariniblastus sp.]|nr:hypothetical protein [Mariniblastus sp.]